MPDVSWKDNFITSSKHYSSQTFLDIASDLGLEQMVQFPTRCCNSLDLNFTSHPSYQKRCKSLPHISERSDTTLYCPPTSQTEIEKTNNLRMETRGPEGPEALT